MARMVRDARLETREARRRLPAQQEPHWKAIHQGAHLGYYKGPRGGTWIARWRGTRSYVKEKLGQADDHRDAGLAVLSYRQAQDKAAEWFEQQERKAAGLEKAEPSGPLTVRDAATAYLGWFAEHRKSLVETKNAIEAHVLPTLGDVEVAKLTAAQVRKWHEGLAKQAARIRTRKGEEQRYKEASDDHDAVRARRASANRVLTVLKAMLNKAHDDGKVASDEAWERVKPFRGADAARVRYLSADECRRLLNSCPGDLRRLVRGALVAGARYGELCRMEVQDFNRDAGSLQVREAKGGKPRWIPLDDEAVEFFVAITAGRKGNAPMFVRAEGKRWRKSHQARPLLEACSAARIDPPASFHVLRHTWASHRVMRGMPLMVVAQVLGHADTRMVEKHYGHLAPSYVRDAVRATAMDLGPHEAGNVTVLRPAAG